MGRVAKRHFAGACGMRSSKRSVSTIACPALPRAGNDRVFLRAARALAFGRKMEPVRAAFFQKRSIMGALRGSNPEKLTFIPILVPTRFLFHARFRFERRNSSETEVWMFLSRWGRERVCSVFYY